MMYNFRQIDVSIYIHSSFERLMMVFALISDKKLSIRKLVSVTTLGFFLFGTSYVPALSFESSSASSSLTNIKYSFSDSSQGLYNQFKTVISIAVVLVL